MAGVTPIRSGDKEQSDENPHGKDNANDEENSEYTGFVHDEGFPCWKPGVKVSDFDTSTTGVVGLRCKSEPLQRISDRLLKGTRCISQFTRRASVADVVVGVHRIEHGTRVYGL